MTPTTIAPSPLVYNGEVINYRDDMVSLTDMWRAAGADPQHAPAKWRALPRAKAFFEHLEVAIGKSDTDLFATVVGGTASGTWAHWQIGLAYAKHLSPAFHMWCNEVVRERMEARSNRTIGARDIQVAFRAWHAIGTLVGFSRNEAALAANRATIKTVGVDALETLGVTHLIAETQEELLTATIIGHRLELSAQSVNKRLEALGFQEASKDSHGHKTWHPTEKGKPFGLWFDTSKAHKDGASVLQWKWFATIVDEIQAGGQIAILSAAAHPSG